MIFHRGLEIGNALKRPKGVKGVRTPPASPAHHDPPYYVETRAKPRADWPVFRPYHIVYIVLAHDWSQLSFLGYLG